MANTVKIKKYSDVVVEYPAGGTITPGHLVRLNSSGQVVVHASSAGKVVPIMFALEDELQGRDITGNYSSGDRVQVWIPGRGDVVNAILTTSQAVAVGDFLVSNGDGTLKELTGDTATVYEDATVVGVAIEAVTTTSSTARIKVMII